MQIGKVPFAIEMKNTFKDGEHLYYVFENCPYGTLNELASIYPNECVPIDICAYYTAEVIIFLNSLHS